MRYLRKIQSSITKGRNPGNRTKFLICSCFVFYGTLFLNPHILAQTARISVSINNGTILELFNQIEKNTPYKFFYKSDIIDNQLKFDFSAENVPVSAILDSVLVKQHLKYEFLLDKIIIKPLQAGSKVLQGTIKDAYSGEVLSGVFVVLKGTGTGVVSANDGTFSLETTEDSPTLIFQLIGYSTLEQNISDKRILNVQLIPAIEALDEVIVIGYGVSKKSDLTGAISSVKADRLFMGTNSPEQMLQGKLSGVRVVSNNGEPGAGAYIAIRGVSTIITGLQPLYVLDGVPLDGRSPSPAGVTSSSATSFLNFLNPNDIESIDVLKDASSAAIYGSRGAGGVILITTKKGKEGKYEINYSSNFSVSNLPKKLDVLSADEWRAFRKDPIKGLGITGVDNGDYGASTDWQDLTFRTAYSQDHNLSLSGSNQRSNYRVSLNYLNQQGIIKQSDISKYIGHLNLTQKGFENKLTFETSINLSFITENRAPVGATGTEGDIIINAIMANPTIPIKDSLGNPFQTSSGERFPSTLLTYYKDLTRTANLLGKAAVNIEIARGLSLKTNFGLSYSNARRLINQSEKLIFSSPTDRNAQINEKELYNYLIENTANYILEIGPHNFNLLAGYSFQDFTIFTSGMYGGDYISDGFNYTDDIGAGLQRQVESARGNNKIQSFFGRINYSLLSRYLLTATIRRDGSTKFGKKRKFGNFPSFSLAWRLSEEEYIKNTKIFSNLKLRAGWGLTGNSDIPMKQTQPTYILNPQNIALIGNSREISGIGASRAANSNLQWEATETYNIGLDFGVLKGRLSGSIDLFRKTSKDLLLQIPAPPGKTSARMYTNLDSTKIINDGLEISLTAIPVVTNNFSWEINGNINFLKNIIRNLPVYQYQTGTAEGPGVQSTYVQVITNNMSVGQFIGYKIDSIGYKGQIYYLDKKTNPERDSSNVILGNALPDFTWSLSSNFIFKNLDLSIFIEGVHGNKIYNNTAMLADKTSIRTSNALRYFVEDNTSIVQKYYSRVSDRYLEDGSYVRLSTVSLGYTFKPNVHSFIKSCKMYIAASNLFIITKYKGYDPDVNSDRANGMINSFGIDFTNYPKARTYSLGIIMLF